AAADRAEAGVAHRALELRVGTADLETGVDHLKAPPLSGELGDRDLAHGVLAAQVAAQGVVGDSAPCLEPERELRQAMSQRLVVRAAAHPLKRPLERDLHRPDGP